MYSYFLGQHLRLSTMIIDNQLQTPSISISTEHTISDKHYRTSKPSINHPWSPYHELETSVCANKINQHATAKYPTSNSFTSISIRSMYNCKCLKLTSEEHILGIVLLSAIYFLWFLCIAGITIVHIIIYALLVSFYFFSDRTRRFIRAIFIYCVYLFLYDTLHLIPNYTVSAVHIGDIYRLEKKFFGIDIYGHSMTLNEYFQERHMPVLDVLTGICYLNW
jgi:hypothetical protein